MPFGRSFRGAVEVRMMGMSSPRTCRDFSAATWAESGFVGRQRPLLHYARAKGGPDTGVPAQPNTLNRKEGISCESGPRTRNTTN